jgi:AraC family transcriptional regulator
MNIEPKIVTIPEKKLIGMRIRNSLALDKTSELWQSFMPRRREIINAVSSDLYSLRVYDSPSYFTAFNMSATFDKWALTEVADFDQVPFGMERLVLPGGLYAVFPYQGFPSAAGETYRYIYATWLPGSQYALDDRPHFEMLDEKYKNNEPSSEEDIFIPIKPKA